MRSAEETFAAVLRCIHGLSRTREDVHAARGEYTLPACRNETCWRRVWRTGIAQIAVAMNAALEAQLVRLATALVDVSGEQSRVAVVPSDDRRGFWFGGGGLARDPTSGRLVLVGRYRDGGDSRTGTAAGTRGKQLVLFALDEERMTFERVVAWDKRALDMDGRGRVLSIEGADVMFLADGQVRLLVSTEREQPYPEAVAEYQKKGTGVWQLDVIESESLAELDAAVMRGKPAPRPLLRSTVADRLHVKDPFFLGPGLPGGMNVGFCSHPFCWTTAASCCVGLDLAASRVIEAPRFDVLPRGRCWDVASVRWTSRLRVPRIGAFASLPPMSLYFYDGCECVREHEQSDRGVERPRGHSCEELGGLAYGVDADFPAVTSLTPLFPLFVSPLGTGSTRYVHAMADEPSGDLMAVWQQSNANRAQPLMFRRLPADQVAALLA